MNGDTNIKGKSFRLTKFGNPPEEMEVDFPAPLGREAILRVCYTGVCHSDVYIMDGYQDLGNGEKMDFAESAMPMPLTMGHETVGEVVSVGPEVDPDLIGQRRLVYPWIGCGKCSACLQSLSNHCENAQTIGIFRDGGYADYVKIPDSKFLVDIEGLDPAWSATLACSGLTIFSSLNQLGNVHPSASVAIVGLGGLGLMAVTMAKVMGIENLIACDIGDDRLAVAKSLGAAQTINSRSVDVAETLREVSGGNLYGVVDTVGLPETVNFSIEAAMKGGKIVLVGLQGGRIDLPLPTLPFKALSLIGTYTGSLAELRDLVDLAKRGVIEPIPVKTRPMKCLHKTLEELRRGEIVGRVVLEPDSGGSSR